MTIVLGVLGFIVAWLIFTFNKLVSLKNQVANAFKQIDVQLKRRYDLIPNLVNAVKGYMKFEQATLEKVIQARNQALSSTGAGVKQRAQNEGQLTQALGRLFALAESYPDLKANQNVRSLMEELAHTENQVSFSRQLYNDLVTRFNTAQQTFPNNFVAGTFGFSSAELFEIPEDRAAEREVPKVNLGD
ncbi:MAG: LemA family protein [Elusimicrobia bacterium]|nr:LemA family protein [Elusimicrobiota bacterium]